jgi:hypothetical protein
MVKWRRTDNVNLMAGNFEIGDRVTLGEGHTWKSEPKMKVLPPYTGMPRRVQMSLYRRDL